MTHTTAGGPQEPRAQLSQQRKAHSPRPMGTPRQVLERKRSYDQMASDVVRLSRRFLGRRGYSVSSSDSMRRVIRRR